MAGRSDEVQQHMDAVVAESGVTLDSGLLGDNVVVLSFDVANQLCKAGLVVDIVTEARRVNDRQRDAGAFLVELEFCAPLSA